MAKLAIGRARAGNDSHLFRDDVIVAPPSDRSVVLRVDLMLDDDDDFLPPFLPLLSPPFSHSLSSHLSLSGSAIVTGAIRWWWTDRKAGGENSESDFPSSLHLGGLQLST